MELKCRNIFKSMYEIIWLRGTHKIRRQNAVHEPLVGKPCPKLYKVQFIMTSTKSDESTAD